MKRIIEEKDVKLSLEVSDTNTRAHILRLCCRIMSAAGFMDPGDVLYVKESEKRG